MTKSSTRRRAAARGRRGQQGGGTSWIVVAVIICGLVIIAGVAVSLISQGGSIDGLKSYGPIQGGVHVNAPVKYDQSPPVGGEHYPVWQNCGIYDQPVQNENAVHSMEHGAVWLTYRPDLPAADLEQLRGLVRGRSYALLSPYPGQDTPVAISAWGFQLKVDAAGDPRLGQFIARFRQGPQAPEPGAVCVGGVGTPVDS
jgi:hypothetical protein